MQPLLVLVAIRDRPRHGQEVRSWIERVTGGRVAVGDGTLYPLAARLEEAGWIERFTGRSTTNRRARYLRLTGEGKEALEEMARRWREVDEAVEAALRA